MPVDLHTRYDKPHSFNFLIFVTATATACGDTGDAGYDVTSKKKYNHKQKQNQYNKYNENVYITYQMIHSK